MAQRVKDFIKRRLHRRLSQSLARDAERAKYLNLSDLRDLRARARHMQKHLDRIRHVADGRLRLPLLGSNAMQTPVNSDWSYRPQMWRGPINPTGKAGVQNKTRFGDEITVFHDCPLSEVTLRQVRNTRESDLAPFGMSVDVLGFQGSFLSLVIELPIDTVEGLKRNHLVRLAAVLETTPPVNMTARLNLKFGPNSDQLSAEFPADAGETHVEFDLAYSKFSGKRIERMWVDLLIHDPKMRQVIFRDVTFSRRPRAEI